MASTLENLCKEVSDITGKLISIEQGSESIVRKTTIVIGQAEAELGGVQNTNIKGLFDSLDNLEQAAGHALVSTVSSRGKLEAWQSKNCGD
jgi:hypothetical protein